MRRLVVLATIVALCGWLPAALEPVAADAAGRHAAGVGPATAAADDPASTSADPPATPDRAWQAALPAGTPAAGAVLRASSGAHPAHPRLVVSGSSADPDSRSRQHISPLTVSLRI